MNSLSVDRDPETPSLDAESSVSSRHSWAIAGLLILVLGLLYAWQLQPGVAPHGDISKYQFAGPLGGTVHQTGYPLYLMVTWLAAHAFPFAGTATAATVVSTLAAVGAVVMTFLALRELGVRPPIAALFGFVLGVAPFVFYFAVVAELYTLHLFFIAAVLTALLRWRRTGSDIDLGIAIALVALSFAHHMTTAMLLPGILAFVWMVDRRTFQRARIWIVAAGALLAAVSLYGYLIWRAHDQATPFLETAPETWRDLPAIWLGAGAAGSFSLNPVSMLGRLPGLALDVVRTALVAIPLAVVGLRSSWRDAAGVMLGLWAIATLLFALAFRIPDIEGFLIPIVFVLVIWAGVGAEWVTSRYLTSPGVAVAAAALIAAVALVGGIAFVNLQSHDDYEARTRDWLADVPQDSVLAASYTDAMAAFRLSFLEETRTDVVTVSDYPLADPAASVIGRYLDGETVEVPHSRLRLEPGRTVYAPGQAWACDLARAGFGIQPYTEQLFLVLPLTDPGSSREIIALCGESS